MFSKFWKYFTSKVESNTVAESILDNVRVSTVHLFGINHAPEGEPPLLYETMVFGGRLDGFQERYSSKKEAVCGHLATVIMVIKST